MNDFVPFELAVKLKEKGFPQRPDYFNYSSYYDWDGLRKIHSLSNASVWFDPNISRDNIYFAPTISQVVSWLEDKKKIFLTVDIEPMGFFFIINYDILTNDNGEYEFNIYNSTNTYPSSIESALAGIEYVLDNLI